MGKVNFEALFLGPQSENREIFEKLLKALVEEHIYWRKNFHPEDSPSVTLQDQNRLDFIQTVQRMKDVLLRLSARLQASSMPFHSPRYLEHMTSGLCVQHCGKQILRGDEQAKPRD